MANDSQPEQERSFEYRSLGPVPPGSATHAEWEEKFQAIAKQARSEAVDESAEEEENTERDAWASVIDDADAENLTDADERAMKNPQVRQALRRSAGLSRKALASLLGVPESSVVRWEAGGATDNPLLARAYRKFLVASAGVANDAAAQAQAAEEAATQQ